MLGGDLMGVAKSVAAERVGVDDGGDLHFLGVREGVGGVKDGAVAGAEDCDWEWGWHERLLAVPHRVTAGCSIVFLSMSALHRTDGIVE